MTSVRVSAQGHSYVFPARAIGRIGSAPDSDVVLSAPTVGFRHARLASDGDAGSLVDDEVTDGIRAGGSGWWCCPPAAINSSCSEARNWRR